MDKTTPFAPPSNDGVRPVRPECIVTYLSMADDGLITLEPGEYEYYLRRLEYLTRGDEHTSEEQP